MSQAQTPAEAAAEAAAENRAAAYIYIGALMALIFTAVLVALFGWPALGIVFMVLSVLFFAVMLVFTTGS
ncbi:MAG: hypothetical protein Q4G36_11850 [Paracoccus sp. (in: a-proteobacteria)]|nr:hypothetical protein [Paracoccus sp. (in: a-proteobacteria)]